MARPGLQRNRKWPRLVRAIGSEALARGSLELLWDVAYENGDDYLGDSDDVELAAKWQGDAGKLTKALLEAGGTGEPGFIEEVPEKPGRYRVHDLWDHAPDYVRKRRSRETERKTKGAKLRQAADADRTVTGHCPPDGGEGPDNVRRAEDGDCRPAPSGRPRAPAPAPAPTPEEAAAARALAREEATTEPAPTEDIPAPPAADTEARTATATTSPPLVSAQAGEEPAASSRPPAAPTRAAAADTSAPRRAAPVVLDLTELGPLAAELRGRLDRAAEWRFLVAAPERRAEVRAKLEQACEALGVDRAEAICAAIVARRRRAAMDPPKALAFFLAPLAEAVAGGEPEPTATTDTSGDAARGDPFAEYEAEVAKRWNPVVEAMTPGQLDEYQDEKRRVRDEIVSQGLWHSEERRLLAEAETYLFTKWSRRVHGQPRSAAGGV